MLKKEANDRASQVKTTELTRVDHPKNDDILPLSLQCEAVSCGVWTYPSAASDLAFASQLRWESSGIAKFGERDLVLSKDSLFSKSGKWPSSLFCSSTTNIC